MSFLYYNNEDPGVDVNFRNIKADNIYQKNPETGRYERVGTGDGGGPSGPDIDAENIFLWHDITNKEEERPVVYINKTNWTGLQEKVTNVEDNIERLVDVVDEQITRLNKEKADKGAYDAVITELQNKPYILKQDVSPTVNSLNNIRIQPGGIHPITGTRSYANAMVASSLGTTWFDQSNTSSEVIRLFNISKNGFSDNEGEWTKRISFDDFFALKPRIDTAETNISTLQNKPYILQLDPSMTQNTVSNIRVHPRGLHPITGTRSYADSIIAGTAGLGWYNQIDTDPAITQLLNISKNGFTDRSSSWAKQLTFDDFFQLKPRLDVLENSVVETVQTRTVVFDMSATNKPTPVPLQSTVTETSPFPLKLTTADINKSIILPAPTVNNFVKTKYIVQFNNVSSVSVLPSDTASYLLSAYNVYLPATTTSGNTVSCMQISSVKIRARNTLPAATQKTINDGLDETAPIMRQHLRLANNEYEQDSGKWVEVSCRPYCVDTSSITDATEKAALKQQYRTNSTLILKVLDVYGRRKMPLLHQLQFELTYVPVVYENNAAF